MLLILLGIAFGALLIKFYSVYQQTKKRREEEKRIKIELLWQEQTAFIKSKLAEVTEANQQIEKYLDYKSGYFSNLQSKEWHEHSLPLFTQIKDITIANLSLLSDESKAIYAFLHYFKNASSLREEYNKRFIEEELMNYSSFFDDIEGKKLDTQQRTAVITDEDNNLVIAGAGSGKTTTIVGKVNYLLDRYKIKPEELLVISFTNKSALTLAEKIKIPCVEVKTFHKFGKDVILETEGVQPSIFDQGQYDSLINKFFAEQSKDPKFLRAVTEYFDNFLKPVRPQFEFNNRGEYIQYLKDQNFKSYKLTEVVTDGKVTYKKEVVKSIEECKIANFLLFNGIEYEYEYPYEHPTADMEHAQYKPDFTITQNGKKVYLEHFGISRDGSVPPFFKGDETKTASEKYRDDMHWKRETHIKNGTHLIESYSYEMMENTLFDNLKMNLANAGITLQPKSEEEIWKIIYKAASDEVNSFISLIATFITLMKSNNYSFDNLQQRNNQTTLGFERERNALFIKICKPIYDKYQNYLTERNEIDFSDMINKATDHINSGRFKRKISYVIIDEFQDISIGRYQLLKALKTQNPHCKLFCVGDDWQSIYRFAGSDITLFQDFEKYFGCTAISKIETTYRFHQPLIGISSEFIQKNPNQARKDLKGISDTHKTNYHIQYSLGDNQNDTPNIIQIFDGLLNTDKDIGKKTILILGRYGHDLNRIKDESSFLQVDRRSGLIVYRKPTPAGIRTIGAQFLTVHKSKGLEGDIVIVLNCNSGKRGFPTEITDDPVLRLIVSGQDQFENEEERRLFYVAMTRAKSSVYFITEIGNQSKFIRELENKQEISTRKKCPECKTADLVLRKTGTAKTGSTYKFYGCSNFNYGCNYTETEWNETGTSKS